MNEVVQEINVLLTVAVQLEVEELGIQPVVSDEPIISAVLFALVYTHLSCVIYVILNKSLYCSKIMWNVAQILVKKSKEQ